jgi:hypothetical protein
VLFISIKNTNQKFFSFSITTQSQLKVICDFIKCYITRTAPKGIADDEVQPKSELKKTNRNISCFLQGLINIIADLLCGKGISLHGLFPQSSFIVNTS